MNIVFDLGGVVIRWNPKAIIASAFVDPDIRQAVRHGIFGTRDWKEFDRGVVSTEEIIEHGAQRTGRPESDIRLLLDHMLKSMVPDPGTLEIIQRVKDKGHRLYVLSNMPLFSMEYLEREYSFWHLFDGLVISSRIHLVKPQPEIYQHLLHCHGLEAEQTFFTDDTDINLRAAADAGIKTIKFVSPEQCAEEMEALDLI